MRASIAYRDGLIENLFDDRGLEAHRPEAGDFGVDVVIANPFLFGQDADVFDLGADLDGVIADFEVLGDGHGIAAL